MKITKIQTLFACAVMAATAGYLLPKLITASGGQVPVASLTFITTLPLITILLVLFAIPMIRKYRAGSVRAGKGAAKASAKVTGMLSPFYAVRVVLLAKAISISGAIFLGWQAGVVWLQASSPVVTPAIWPNVAALIGAIVMTVAAAIIERICRIRDDGTDAESSGPGSEVNPA